MKTRFCIAALLALSAGIPGIDCSPGVESRCRADSSLSLCNSRKLVAGYHSPKRLNIPR